MDVYVVDYLRTPFSRSRPQQPEKDVFNSIRMDEALAKLIRSSVERTGVRGEEIGDVITGCAFQAGENWLYGGRHPVLLAELPVTVPAMGVDRACASSMTAVGIGAMEISAGLSDVVLAGGMEHMTHVPISNNPYVTPNIKLMTRPEYMRYMMNIGYNMGLTAERLARESEITKDQMDEFSLRSHQLAAKSLASGWFSGEIMPVEVEIEGSIQRIIVDQSIRADTTLEKIRSLPPTFVSDGLVTAGNSSPLNAGSSLVMLMSGRKMNEYGLTPLARVRSIAWVGVEPQLMGKGPVPASRLALKRAGIGEEDVDFWEINEAFAVVTLYVMKELGIEKDKVNVHGGAIAIGHPLGATGARLVGTMGRVLKETGKKIGVSTLCVGGGQGYSVVLEGV